MSETPGWTFEGSALQQHEDLMRRRGEGAFTPLRKMLTGDEIAAANERSRRDRLWNSSECFAEGCGHVWRRLPVVEFRQTIICARCGGLNKELSRELTDRADLFTVAADGLVYRNWPRVLERMRLAEEAHVTRTRQFDQLCREHNELVDELVAGLATPGHTMTSAGGLPRCSCGRPLGAGGPPELFIRHALEVLAETRRRDTEIRFVSTPVVEFTAMLGRDPPFRFTTVRDPITVSYKEIPSETAEAVIERAVNLIEDEEP